MTGPPTIITVGRQDLVDQLEARLVARQAEAEEANQAAARELQLKIDGLNPFQKSVLGHWLESGAARDLITFDEGRPQQVGSAEANSSLKRLIAFYKLGTTATVELALSDEAVKYLPSS